MDSSRRRFMQTLVGGALVVGFDLDARSWITRAVADSRVAGGRMVGLPALDGDREIARAQLGLPPVYGNVDLATGR